MHGSQTQQVGVANMTIGASACKLCTSITTQVYVQTRGPIGFSAPDNKKRYPHARSYDDVVRNVGD